MALIDKLNAIGEAIRAKTGKSEKLTLDEMPLEIGGITEDLDSVLTEQETLIAELKEVLQGKASAPPAETMVGLWEFNEELEIDSFDFYFNFTLPRLGSRLFTNLFTDIGDDYANLLCADDEVENTMYLHGSGWAGQEFRLMHLAEEPEDAEAKAWIKAHARKLTYDECYEEGEKAILSTYVDWAVSAASNACIVDFYNECDYYAHIYAYVGESITGEFWSRDFVIAPYDSYTISTEEMGWDVQSAEWYVRVTIKGFSKDGEL
jgi:hypothetical protein